jgi:glutaminyl-peptide cyclotransferase
MIEKGRVERMRRRTVALPLAMGAGFLAIFLFACGNGAPKDGGSPAASSQPAAASAQNAAPIAAAPSDALPADKTGGFDGAKAYDHVAKIVAIGPRPPDSDGIHREQEYIHAQLKDFGCTVEDDDFHSSTPIGSVAMKNIVVKIPGNMPDIILLLTHYDTLKKDGFVGAVDGGSSTGLMLEMARLLCAKEQKLGVWIAFLDGEEAFVDWEKDNDNTYGSRQLAARMALADEIKHVKAVILADMIGPKNLRIMREPNSTGWLVDMVWSNAAKFGYQDAFVPMETTQISDDHLPFKQRKVPVVDIIDLADYPYWHTNDDTIDKVSAKSLGIVGHVILATVDNLQTRGH